MIWKVALGVLVGLALVWLLLIAALLVTRPRGGLLKEALRLLPDLLRLLRRLAADSTLPRGVRWRLGLLLAYLAFPIDLIPDFIPVLGYADDAIIVAAVLRSVVRRVGMAPLRRHWPGTPDGLTAVARLTGLARRPPSQPPRMDSTRPAQAPPRKRAGDFGARLGRRPGRGRGEEDPDRQGGEPDARGS